MCSKIKFYYICTCRFFDYFCRANGRVLLFNSTIILVLVLRYTITKLRELGLAFILPLDNNIYIHKVDSLKKIKLFNNLIFEVKMRVLM